MSVAPQPSPALSRDLPRDARQPLAEPIRLAEPGKVPVCPQETLLRQVLDGGTIHCLGRDDSANEPGVAIVKAAKRLAVARQNAGYQVGVSLLVIPHRHHTSGRRGDDVQPKT